MDYFYDGQLRRYVTQFMRIFIGFKWQAGDGEQKTVPVLYGNMSRQVANIIKENSENKLPTVPRVACYITGLEMATDRLADPTFISKVNIRERRYTDADGDGLVEYQNTQGGNYTVERLMPTPFKLTMKADIWTSNTDQKLQLLEQILVLFNPSLEIQTTDNYIDWTSLSVVNLGGINFSSQSIPQGADTEIDVCSIEFDMPIYITPPAKVKRLGVVKSIIANMFTEKGDIVNLEELIYNQDTGNAQYVSRKHRVLLFKANNGQPHDYELVLVSPTQPIQSAGLEKETKVGSDNDWSKYLTIEGGWVQDVSQVWFKQPSGYDLIGTIAPHPLDPAILLVTFDQDTIPTNTLIASLVNGLPARGTIDAIIDPYKFNPLKTFGSHAQIPLGTRYLMLDDVNPSPNVGQSFDRQGDSAATVYDGPDAWSNSTVEGDDPVITANSIVEWSGTRWATIWDPLTGENPTYIQNLKTGIQYRWDGEQWLKSFEGEYAPGYWGFKLDNC